MKKQRSRSWITTGATAGVSPRRTGRESPGQTRTETSGEDAMAPQRLNTAYMYMWALLMILHGEARVDREQQRTQCPDTEVYSVTGVNKEVWRVWDREKAAVELSAQRCETIPACWLRPQSCLLWPDLCFSDPRFRPLSGAGVAEVAASFCHSDHMNQSFWKKKCWFKPGCQLISAPLNLHLRAVGVRGFRLYQRLRQRSHTQIRLGATGGQQRAESLLQPE